MKGDWKLEPIEQIVRYIDRKAYFTAFQSLTQITVRRAKFNVLYTKDEFKEGSKPHIGNHPMLL